jgi:hypothetical protein
MRRNRGYELRERIQKATPHHVSSSIETLESMKRYGAHGRNGKRETCKLSVIRAVRCLPIIVTIARGVEQLTISLRTSDTVRRSEICFPSGSVQMQRHDVSALQVDYVEQIFLSIKNFCS